MFSLLLVKHMLHNLRLEILPSSIQHFHCPPSYPLFPVSKHTAKKLDHLQPDSFVDLPAEAVPEASQQPEGEVLVVVRARDSPRGQTDYERYTWKGATYS